MKVVLLAGGLGTRMREETEFRPKPMVQVGGKPILWHIVKIFASNGHTDFVVCAGYKSAQVRDYFYHYSAMNMDFTVRLGDSGSATFHGSHEEFDWSVTVADTGLHTPTGGRINKIRRYVEDDSFFCTYGDGLAPVDLSALLQTHKSTGSVATVTVAHPLSRYGTVRLVEDGRVTSFEEKPQTSDLVSIGFFVFEPKIFGFFRMTRSWRRSPWLDWQILEDSPPLSTSDSGSQWTPIASTRA